jgi:uncharacterized protein
MKLRVDQITEEVKHTAFSEPAEEMNRRLAHGEVRDFRLLAPLSVETSYYRAGDDLYFSGHIVGSFEGTCARCLEPYAVAMDQGAQFVLVPTPTGSEEGELSDDDLALSFYGGDEVDLSPLFTEQAILSLPTRALCAEECRGLCPECGANRNHETCACGEPEPDPRLAVLRNLRVERSS